MAALGVVFASPIGLAFLRCLDGIVLPQNPLGVAALSIKFILDQVVGCAIWQVCMVAVYPPYLQSLQQAFNFGKSAEAVSSITNAC